MNDFTSELVKTLLEGNSITEVFREHMEKAINNIIKLELTEYLNYEKYDRKGFNYGILSNCLYYCIMYPLLSFRLSTLLT